MTKPEFISAIAEKGDITKTLATEMCDVIFDTLTEAIVKGETVAIPNFGKFSSAYRGERKGHNPQTGESIIIAARKAVKFTPSSVLKNALNE